MVINSKPDFKQQTAQNHGISSAELKAVVYFTAGNYIVYANKDFGPFLIEGMKKKRMNVHNFNRWQEANSLTPPKRGALMNPHFFGVEDWPSAKVLYITI